MPSNPFIYSSYVNTTVWAPKAKQKRNRILRWICLLAGHGKHAVPGVGRFLEQILLAPLPISPRRPILRPPRQDALKRTLGLLPIPVAIQGPRLGKPVEPLK